VTTFVDTSAIYAVFDRDDENHARAVRSWNELLDGDRTLMTNNYVLVETSALLQHRLGLAALRAFHQDVVPLLTVDWIGQQRHQAGVEAVLAAARKKLSVVDCISFQTMREYGIRQAFCFDQHFRQQGFETIP
jgi:predicted nucleic acid-binding protein